MTLEEVKNAVMDRHLEYDRTLHGNSAVAAWVEWIWRRTAAKSEGGAG